MTLRLNTAKQVQLAAAGVADLTHLDVYTGAQPASANDAPGGVLLGTITGITWDTTGNPAVADGSVDDEDADASGVAGWGRFRNAAGTLRMDGAVGTDFVLDDVNIVAAGVISLISAALSQPSGEA